MMPSFDMMHICAPNVAPQTLAAIIQVESGGNPFALGINGNVKRLPRPTNAAEAARQARYYISLGYSVDLGLMQINSNNLRGLGYTVEQVLDPCNNLKAGSRILSRGYAGAVRRYGPGQEALKAALSAYNTGNYELGFKNGYVAKYYSSKGIQVIVTAPPPSMRPEWATQSAKPDIYHTNSTVYSLLEEESRPALPLVTEAVTTLNPYPD